MGAVRALADEGAVPAQRQDGQKWVLVYWLVLVLSGALEAVWATALAESDGLRRRGPAGLFVVSVCASTAGLAYAMRGLPAGTSYAVWVGIGAVGTVLLAVARGQERLGLTRGLLLLLLVSCVLGLKVVA